jgi:exportin-T
VPKLRNPLTRVLFMEINVRYAAELRLQADLIPRVLEFFAGPLGIHSNETQVQLRSWYLFERLLGKLQINVGTMLEQILSALTDLLQIHVSSTSAMLESSDTDSESDSEHDVFFDSQLYLFQLVGLLIASMETSDLAIRQAVLVSLNANINQLVQNPSPDQPVVLSIHHTIMAIGNVAKGYDGASAVSVLPRQEIGHRLFAPSTDMILKALTRFEDSAPIRDAVNNLLITNLILL